MSSNARRDQRRREWAAELERLETERHAEVARRKSLCTRSLFYEAKGFTDEQEAFLTRLMDILDGLGVDTYDV